MKNAVNAVIALALLSGSAYAGDTLEPYKPGVTGFEIYGQAGDVSASERSVGTLARFGVGLTDNFSAMMAFSASGTDELVQTGSAQTYSLLYTPLNGAHVDLDLTFDVSSGGDGLGVTPGFELNYDGRDDMLSYGVYLRGLLPMGPGEDGRVTSVTINPGAYYTVAGAGHLVLEYAQGFEVGEDPETAGRVSIGYNHFFKSMELITDVGVNDGVYDVTVGLFAFLPAVQ